MLKHHAEHLSLLAAEPEHFAAPPDHRCLGVYSVGADTQCLHRWQQGDALTLDAWYTILIRECYVVHGDTPSALVCDGIRGRDAIGTPPVGCASSHSITRFHVLNTQKYARPT